VSITYNGSLKSVKISSLPTIKAGGLNISNNGSIPTGPLTFDLSALTSVTGGLGLVSNPTMQVGGGLGSLQLIQGDLSVQSNGALTALDQLTALATITGSVTLYNNAALATANGLTTIKAGGLNISNNGSIPTGPLTFDLSALTSVTGGLGLVSNPTMQVGGG